MKEIRRAPNGLACILFESAKRVAKVVISTGGAVEVAEIEHRRFTEKFPESVAKDLRDVAVAAREYLKAEKISSQARSALNLIIKEYQTMTEQAEAKKAAKNTKAAKPAAPAKKTGKAKAAPKATKPAKAATAKAEKSAKVAPTKAAKTAKSPGSPKVVKKVDDSTVRGGFLREYVDAALKLKTPFTRDDLHAALKSKEDVSRQNRYFNYCASNGIFIL